MSVLAPAAVSTARRAATVWLTRAPPSPSATARARPDGRPLRQPPPWTRAGAPAAAAGASIDGAAAGAGVAGRRGEAEGGGQPRR